MGSKIVWRPKAQSWSNDLLAPRPARRSARLFIGFALCVLIGALVQSTYIDVSATTDNPTALQSPPKGTRSSSHSPPASAASTEDLARSGALAATPGKLGQLPSTAPLGQQPQVPPQRMVAVTNRSAAETTGSAGEIDQSPMSAGNFVMRPSQTDPALAPASNGPSLENKGGASEKPRKAKQPVIHRKPDRYNETTAQAANAPVGRTYVSQPFFGFWSNNAFASQGPRSSRQSSGWRF